MRTGFVVMLLLFILSAEARGASREDTWMSVTLDGRKIGQMLNTRDVRGDRVITTQVLDVRIDRAGIGIGLVTSETSEESRDGKPLGFSARSQLSGIETSLVGTISGKSVSVTSSVGGASTTKTQAWPEGAVLAEGLRLSALQHGLAAGTEYSDIAFQPSSLDAIRATTRVVGTQIVDLPGGRKVLFRLDQDLAIPGMPMQSQAYVDAKQNIHKLVMTVLGQRMELLACSRACAQAPNQPTDMLKQALLAAPRALDNGELQHAMRYTVSARDPAQPISIPGTDEQQVHSEGGQFRLDVSPQARPGGDPPVAADRAANAWLQSDAPEIVALAKQAAGDAGSDLQRMQQLETFVRGYIQDKNLSVGYASALEVAKTREGDCTEHALLLAALGRALSIPTRVVDGLAYTGQFGGAQRVFVPHAWAQAWVDGRWQSFDAALRGFDSGHIALGIGDGDPWRFFSGIATLGNLKLEKIEIPARP